MEGIQTFFSPFALQLCLHARKNSELASTRAFLHFKPKQHVLQNSVSPHCKRRFPSAHLSRKTVQRSPFLLFSPSSLNRSMSTLFSACGGGRRYYYVQKEILSLTFPLFLWAYVQHFLVYNSFFFGSSKGVNAICCSGKNPIKGKPLLAPQYHFLLGRRGLRFPRVFLPLLLFPFSLLSPLSFPFFK